MSQKNFSLILAGIIWILVGLRIGARALGWLEPHFANPSPWLALLVVSILIAIGKSATVLKKSVNRNLGNLHKISNDDSKDYFLGVFKLFGVKGLILIILMIALGFLLRYLKAIGLDPYNVFGFIYLGISGALILGSLNYFKAVAKK